MGVVGHAQRYLNLANTLEKAQVYPNRLDCVKNEKLRDFKPRRNV